MRYLPFFLILSIFILHAHAKIGSEHNHEINEIRDFFASVSELRACSYGGDSANRVFPHNSILSVGSGTEETDKEIIIPINGKNFSIIKRSIKTLGFRVYHGTIKDAQGVIRLVKFNRFNDKIIIHEGSANLILGNIEMKISAYSDRGVLGIADGKIVELIKTELNCNKH